MFFKQSKLLFQTLVLTMQLFFRKSKSRNEKAVFVYLNDPRCGQYMHALLSFFLVENYHVKLFPNLKFLTSLIRYKCKLLQFKNLNLAFRPGCDVQIYLTNSSYKPSNKLVKILRVSYQYFNPQTNSIVMPYPMHPNQYNPYLVHYLKNQRENRKSIGVFFSGNQDRNAYRNATIYTIFKKINRIELLDYIIEKIPKDKIHIVSSEQLDDSSNPQRNKFVLIDWKWSQEKAENLNIRIDEQQWLVKLSTCNFFLACPGMYMPICHNIIEAMAVGAIPITQYANQFYPPLQNGINCIEFFDKDDAVKKILYALTLSESQIAFIRKGVIEYYEKHLSPRSFVASVEKLENNAILTINAEQLSLSSL
jgi:hypothetical protein